MIGYLLSRRQELLSGVLFRPGLVVLVFGVLGLALPTVDGNWPVTAPFIFSGDAPAARTVLSTVASSLITVAALSFSLMIVTLQLVSSQFTPRAIRGLLADRTHQLTIGTFVGIFMYCLLVLRLVRDDGFVPALSVTVAVAFGLGGLLLLVFFIHNLSQSIKVSRIVARISHATTDAIEDLYPDLYSGGDRGAAPAQEQADALQLHAAKAGYVQAIHVPTIVDAARTRVHVRVRPGDFVTRKMVLASIARGDSDGELDRVLRRAIAVAEERDVEQDARHGMRQLADIALRALSPALNDPSTAVLCIQHLGICLDELVCREIVSPQILSCPSGAELIVERVTFEEHLEEAFAELPTSAADQPRVARELLTVLARASDTAGEIGARDREQALRALAASVRDADVRTARGDDDRATAAAAEALPDQEEAGPVGRR